MPNWCSNSLTVSGDKELVRDFAEACDTGDKDQNHFSFNGIVRMPPENSIKQTSVMPGWYDWRHKNWGTKWDACDVYIVEQPKNGTYIVNFETAWGPPLAWLERASKRFPTLHMELDYAEPGMAFKGTATAINGHVNNESRDMQFDDEGNEIEDD